jgi:hypothetical protein
MEGIHRRGNLVSEKSLKRALILAILFVSLLHPQPASAFACTEDVNSDGRVNLADVQAVAAHWPALVGAPYDQDSNGRIDIADVMRVVARMGTVCSGSAIGGCPVFPANNVWNARVDGLPVDSSSQTYVNNIGATAGLHPDFGSGLWDGGPIGIPYTTVPGSQPPVTVTFDYDDESDPGPYPIPPDPPIEGGSDSDGDRHVLVVDTGHCKLYEMFYAWPQPDGSWQAGSGAIFDLTSNTLRQAGWTSADAAGLPILPGLVRYDEVAAGAINHALRFTAPRTRKAYIWPARHYASSWTDPARPPMGQRFRLKASFDISGFSATNQVILTALKTYGMFLADNGSSWFLSGVPDERWDNDDLHQLQTRVHGSDFEAVDESSLMLGPNSGQVR